MMALIISLILLILIIYPLTVRAMRNFTITVPHVIDRAEGQININLKFNHFLPNLLLFMYDIQFVWHESSIKEFSYEHLILFKKEQSLKINVPNRGVYELFISLRLMDIFGLFLFEFPLDHKSGIIVPLPKAQSLKANYEVLYEELKNSYLVKSGKRERSEADFYDFKLYQKGDDVRYLDWRLFARFGELYIKNYHFLSYIKNNEYIFSIIPPSVTTEGEIILEKMLNFSQSLAYFFYQQDKKSIILWIDSHAQISNFGDPSIQKRSELALLSTRTMKEIGLKANVYFLEESKLGTIIEKNMHESSTLFLFTPHQTPLRSQLCGNKETYYVSY
ncbi:DUF58 domain-containing protein [Entomospira culicis]|uniref:DUF58 domain-containing protein n=1 Tax=Entomospira culicis TaxID=2719989 RepID=A0A968GF32_9SPIO|nr:DUF58 domain-containing protein [Entomospira culicis]NIZ19119.1 DUF58 domain-containing protein [Entomospira culicis]NIZ69333.1 DUF58 domain-containing protein [Entomospira culicis]WDI37919.1 DUF58 domain-containing protein [Entomospira culicis]WDI39546.1 DUF58 domain-containing protein [Entomospira culicis]